MAEHDAERAVQETVRARLEQLKEGKHQFDIDRALELGVAFDKMTEALQAAKKALEQVALKKPEERTRAEEKLLAEIQEALVALHTKLQTHESYATDLVDKTRAELERLGATAQQGPEAYEKPRLFGLLGDPSQFDQWMKDLDKNPAAALDALVGVSRAATNEIRTEAEAEVARRAGAKVKPNTPPNVLSNYLSSNATEEHLRRIDEQR